MCGSPVLSGSSVSSCGRFLIGHFPSFLWSSSLVWASSFVDVCTALAILFCLFITTFVTSINR